jgi:hypothetical protein
VKREKSREPLALTLLSLSLEEVLAFFEVPTDHRQPP